MWNLSPLNCSSNTSCLLRLQVLSSPTSCYSECGKESGAWAKESNIQKVFQNHTILWFSSWWLGVDVTLTKAVWPAAFSRCCLLMSFHPILKGAFCGDYSRGDTKIFSNFWIEIPLDIILHNGKASLFAILFAFRGNKINSIQKLAGFCIVNISLMGRPASQGDWTAFLGATMVLLWWRRWEVNEADVRVIHHPSSSTPHPLPLSICPLLRHPLHCYSSIKALHQPYH